MKKLMTAFAACMLAGLVSAQVESQNIVGYSTTTVSAGFTSYASPFITVGSTTNVGMLSAITGNFSDFDTIQVLGSDGNYTTLCSWLTTAIGVPADGWYNDSLEPVEVTDLVQGESLVLSTASSVNVLNAGQVNQGVTTVSLAAGFAAAGNGTPSPVQLSAMTFGGGITDFDTIQLLGVDGNYTTLCSWLTTTIGVPADGWYNDSLEPVDHLFDSSEGFVVSSAAGCTLSIPSPL